MFWAELILIVIIIILLYFLFKKNIKPENTAPVVNKTNKDDLGKRVIIEELEDQFFALDKYNLIKYLNKSAKQRFGEGLIDKNISSVIRDTKLLETIDEAIKDQTTKNVNVENKDGKKVWKSSEILKLKPWEYAKVEQEIDTALREGRVVRDTK